jgi:hypothetical protein
MIRCFYHKAETVSFLVSETGGDQREIEGEREREREIWGVWGKLQDGMCEEE